MRGECLTFESSQDCSVNILPILHLLLKELLDKMISLMVYDSQYSILNDSANFYIQLDNSFWGIIMFSLNSFLVMILLKKAYDRNHELWTQLLLKITRRKLISNKQTEIQSILITIVQGYMELIWGPENKQITSSSKLIFSSAYYFCGVSIVI